MTVLCLTSPTRTSSLRPRKGLDARGSLEPTFHDRLKGRLVSFAYRTSVKRTSNLLVTNAEAEPDPSPPRMVEVASASSNDWHKPWPWVGSMGWAASPMTKARPLTLKRGFNVNI